LSLNRGQYFWYKVLTNFWFFIEKSNMAGLSKWPLKTPKHGFIDPKMAQYVLSLIGSFLVDLG
jgi:hypothetical protein